MDKDNIIKAQQDQLNNQQNQMNQMQMQMNQMMQMMINQQQYQMNQNYPMNQMNRMDLLLNQQQNQINQMNQMLNVFNQNNQIHYNNNMNQALNNNIAFNNNKIQMEKNKNTIPQSNYGKIYNNPGNELNLIYEDYENNDIRLFGFYYDERGNKKSFIKNNEGKIEIIIDNQKVKLNQIDNEGYYNFKTKGRHQVKVILKNKKLNVNCMFFKCNKLISASGLENIDTGETTSFKCLFSDCFNLSSISDISNWNISRINDFSYMFDNCSKLNRNYIPYWYKK